VKEVTDTELQDTKIQENAGAIKKKKDEMCRIYTHGKIGNAYTILTGKLKANRTLGILKHRLEYDIKIEIR
jgi:hypothetical protein